MTDTVAIREALDHIDRIAGGEGPWPADRASIRGAVRAAQRALDIEEVLVRPAGTAEEAFGAILGIANRLAAQGFTVESAKLMAMVTAGIADLHSRPQHTPDTRNPIDPLREMALDYAVKVSTGEQADAIARMADTFARFLAGAPLDPADDE